MSACREATIERRTVGMSSWNNSLTHHFTLQAETSRFGDLNRQKTYQHIGRLASALQAELETDQNIQDCGFLPAYTNLPAITGSIFAEVDSLW